MTKHKQTWLLLAIGILCLLALLALQLVFTTREPDDRPVVSSKSTAIPSATPSSESPRPDAASSSPVTLSATRTLSAVPEADATSPSAPSTPPSQPIYAYSTFSFSSTIAVVDVRYLLTAHPPTDSSDEARARALADIRAAISECARAFRLSIVLDSSAESRPGVRVVLSANPALDITADVRQYLHR